MKYAIVIEVETDAPHINGPESTVNGMERNIRHCLAAWFSAHGLTESYLEVAEGSLAEAFKVGVQ